MKRRWFPFLAKWFELGMREQRIATSPQLQDEAEVGFCGTGTNHHAKVSKHGVNNEQYNMSMITNNTKVIFESR